MPQRTELNLAFFHMKKFSRLSIPGSFLIIACAAVATTVIPPSFDDLVGRAEMIFQGTVTDVRSEWAGEGAQRHIMSYVTVKVEETIKGNPGASVTLQMLGGTVGAETMEVADAPKFKVGDHDILFVENNGTQFVPLVGIMHGRFRLTKDAQSGAEMVLANNGNTVTNLQTLGRTEAAAVSKAPNTNAVERPFDAESFKAAIRSKLGAQ